MKQNATPAGQSPREFRLPRGPGLLSLFVAIFVGITSSVLFAAAIWLITQHWGLGLLVGAVACFCAGLTAYVWRDFRGKWGLRILLDRDAVALDLPSGRSLIHRVPAQRLRIPYADIAAVETRLEGYRSLGMANMQRAYALRQKSGEWVFLFEDRALATSRDFVFCRCRRPAFGAGGRYLARPRHGRGRRRLSRRVGGARSGLDRAAAAARASGATLA